MKGLPHHLMARKNSLMMMELCTSGTEVLEHGFAKELSKKAQKANNMWWRLSGVLGDHIMFQAAFTVATMALTVPIFLSYELHVIFQILKVSASIWNEGEEETRTAAITSPT
ncbi:uncharacterized protein LOC113308204 [Papaver somniferum]|uniref:uncharacterized protein LOC113308204 n=1 Tax=Papaver somniferum TaxID=3469 RepID=UPI000E700C1C|nr:uncharacterized protein LOC113308204 [Papaver somniferum]